MIFNGVIKPNTKKNISSEKKKKQINPEEFENDDRPDRIYVDNEGRTVYSCTACKCPKILPYHWRPHKKRSTYAQQSR
jgi:hypothetical protein